MHTTHATHHSPREATRLTVTVRHVEGAPEVAQIIELRGDDAPAARGRDAVVAAITRALARGERLELVPLVQAVPPTSDEAVGLRATLHDPTVRLGASSPPMLATPQDMHALGLRLERPSSRRAREVYATLLGVDAGDLRGAEDGGVWRWYTSDRTVRWAPHEGAPWALRWKARRSACRTPRELWELLASRSILPQEWVGSAAREFHDAPSRREEEALDDAPVTMLSALALSSDVDGMACAEALMFEAASALSPWGAPTPAKIRWSAFGERYAWYENDGAPVIPAALNGLVERTEEAYARRKPFLTALERAANVHYSRSFVAQGLVELRLAWQQWCAEDRRVPARMAEWSAMTEPRASWRSARTWSGTRWKCPAALVGKRFRDLADPTEPLLGVVALGYTPDSIEAEAASIRYRVR